MHRVELKALSFKSTTLSIFIVPNAPCGVESAEDLALLEPDPQLVPNAPCGVESSFSIPLAISSVSFLMHRVELKGSLRDFKISSACCLGS